MHPNIHIWCTLHRHTSAGYHVSAFTRSLISTCMTKLTRQRPSRAIAKHATNTYAAHARPRKRKRGHVDLRQATPAQPYGVQYSTHKLWAPKSYNNILLILPLYVAKCTAAISPKIMQAHLPKRGETRLVQEGVVREVDEQL